VLSKGGLAFPRAFEKNPKAFQTFFEYSTLHGCERLSGTMGFLLNLRLHSGNFPGRIQHCWEQLCYLVCQGAALPKGVGCFRQTLQWCQAPLLHQEVAAILGGGQMPKRTRHMPLQCVTMRMWFGRN